MISKLNHISEVYIIGAASRAKTLKGYLDFLYPNINILSFLVDTMQDNDEMIDGIPVQLLSSENCLRSDVPALIATKGVYHDSIGKELKSIGIQNIIPITVDVDNFFRNEYVKKYFSVTNLPFIKFDELPSADVKKTRVLVNDAKVYMAKSIYDKPLETKISLQEYIVPIQVGAILTEERLDPQILTDCTGDNISKKNRQYSELTALYWIWKQAGEEIVGLCHYRRHFVLPEDWIRIFKANGVDVVLPVPTIVLPSIADNYKERHDASDWDFLMDYLKQNDKDSFAVAEYIFAGRLYSPCNMFIMKREILLELCAWMFPILFAVEKHGGMKEDVYQNRYLGFVSERLITLFFHMVRDKYKIVYADKTFLQ